MKVLRTAFSSFLSVSPWQRTTRKQMFEHIFCNYGLLPLWYECKVHKIWNFDFSENLRPDKPLIDSSPLFPPRIQDISRQGINKQMLVISHVLNFLWKYERTMYDFSNVQC